MAEKKKGLWERAKERMKEEAQLIKDSKPAYGNIKNAENNVEAKKKKKREY